MKLSAIRPITAVLARELPITALLLFGVSMVVFTILYFAPGDPFSVLLEGQEAGIETQLGVVIVNVAVLPLRTGTARVIVTVDDWVLPQMMDVGLSEIVCVGGVTVSEAEAVPPSVAVTVAVVGCITKPAWKVKLAVVSPAAT